MEKIRNYINGQFLDPIEGEYLNNYNPSTGQVYSLIPSSSEKDVELAVLASEKAFPLWANLPAEERGKIIQKIADGIEKRMDEFAKAESKDNGKPVSLAAHVDIPRAVSNFSFFATGIQHFSSESHYMEGVG
ncbi:MAG: aldehyde dehydrogenase family protein, partial [Bacteroidetes bacterium]|nr:aldehyde dehydrogenase family protein [Bacteroidota bacterium]